MPFTSFGKLRGGLNPECKYCNAERANKYYHANKAVILQKYKTPERRAAIFANKKRSNAKNREKYLARRATMYAAKKGNIARPASCQSCGNECKPEAHHYLGYARPFHTTVQWLCSSCHVQIERFTKSLLNHFLVAS